MRKKFITGAAVLALLMNSPQVKADDIVVFGSEFEDETPAPKKVTKPAPIKELPPPEEKPAPPPIEEPAPPPLEEPQLPPPTVEEPEQTPPPIEEPVTPPPPPVEEKPELVEPQDRPPIQPVEQPAEPEQQPAQVPPQEVPDVPPEDDDDDLGDTLVFDDLSKNPEQQPVEQPLEQPQQPATPDVKIELPTPTEPAQLDEPPIEPLPPTQEIDKPFVPPTPKLPATPDVQIELPQQGEPEPETPVREQTTIRQKPTQPAQPARRPSTRQPAQPQQKLKTLKPRFTKLAVDDTYTYYLDKNSVQWKKMPYSSSEYIADVWIRMVERTPAQLNADMASYGEENFNAEISLAREQGYQYSPDDLQVLSSQAYVLEHYYLRPKTRQIQFLCELEVFGRPQNTISERVYDYKNWENLVPGSVESVIYDAVIKIVGKSKSSERGHMTFIDMLDEYARIALN